VTDSEKIVLNQILHFTANLLKVISKYKQKEFEKIVNLIYTDVFRIE
jgi:hypothetical protein